MAPNLAPVARCGRSASIMAQSAAIAGPSCRPRLVEQSGQWQRAFSTTIASAKAAAKPATGPKKVTRKPSAAPTLTGQPSEGVRRRKMDVASLQALVAEGNTAADFVRGAASIELKSLNAKKVEEGDIDQALAFSQSDLDAFDKFGLTPKSREALYSHTVPSSVYLAKTHELYGALSNSAEKAQRRILMGPQGAGKSRLLLQAVSYARAHDWLTIYIPSLTSFVKSSTAFAYSQEHEAFVQPALIRKLFEGVLAVNTKSLQKIALNDGKGSSEIKLPQMSAFPSTTKLAGFLDQIVKQALPPAAMQAALDVFLTSIVAQSSSKPVLLAIDDVQALYLPTTYRTPDFEVIQSYELAAIRSIIRMLASKGDAILQKGMILGALSESKTDFAVPLEFRAILPESEGTASVPAHSKLHPLHLAHVQASEWEPLHVGGQWSPLALRALYDLRRMESRNWNGGNRPIAERSRDSASAAGRNEASPASSPANTSEAWFAGLDQSSASFDLTRSPGSSGSVRSGEYPLEVSDRAQSSGSEDELFIMRVIDSGGNPARFDKALKGQSIL